MLINRMCWWSIDRSGNQNPAAQHDWSGSTITLMLALILTYQMTDWLIMWLIGWLTGWCNQSIDQSTDRNHSESNINRTYMNERLIGRFAFWFHLIHVQLSRHISLQMKQINLSIKSINQPIRHRPHNVQYMYFVNNNVTMAHVIDYSIISSSINELIEKWQMTEFDDVIYHFYSMRNSPRTSPLNKFTHQSNHASTNRSQSINQLIFLPRLTAADV